VEFVHEKPIAFPGYYPGLLTRQPPVMDVNSTTTLALVTAFLFIAGSELYLPRIQHRQMILDRRGEGVQKVQRWVEGSEEACIAALGMKADTFLHLADYAAGLVSDTPQLPARLKVAITLYMLRKSVNYRTLRDVFQISLRSLSV
jgi:hypothetical protein